MKVWDVARILRNTQHTDGSPYFLITKLPGTRRSIGST